jgi:ABC-type transport system involved in multi-copper enzyme maturation permease subunit
MSAVTITTPPTAPSSSGGGTVRRPSFATLTRVEFRKTVDTRAGQALLGGALLLAVAVVGYLAFSARDGLTYDNWLRDASLPVVALLPVIGILAMASEWTQRTALTTFTLTPRRIRVLGAKFAAAVVLGLLVTVVVDVIAAVGLVVRGLVLDADVTWGNLGSVLGGSAVSAALALVMGAAIGALVMQTAVAIVAYFVAPNVVLLAVASTMSDKAPWVDVNEAFGWLSRFDVSGHVGQLVTPLLLWIAVPFGVGLWRSVRRNVS